MILWDRYRRRRRVTEDPVVPHQLVLLSALSIWTHPTLDWMNSYGLRWLMPFDGTWFYGDSLFIIDPYLLAVLGAAVWLSRKRERAGAPNPWRPARIGLAVTGVYIASMLILQGSSERIAREALEPSGRARAKLVVTASPANPLRWRVHADDGARYWTGNVRVGSGKLVLDAGTLDKGADDIAVIAAVQKPEAGPFLHWARLPFFRVEQSGNQTFVRVTDARYGASLLIPVSTAP